MKYIIELEFKSGVHFGADYAGFGVEDVQGNAHADTIFSALINTLAQIKYQFKNTNWINDFFSDNNDSPVLPFKISSFGFCNTSSGFAHEYYLPKPNLVPNKLVNEKQKHEFGKDFKNRKFISLETFKKWQCGESLDLEKILDKERESFWEEESKVQHLTDNVTAATQIYRTGLVFYYDFILPFFIVDLDENKFSIHDFLELIHSLKFNGLGGRRTTGCGLFEFSDKNWFCIDIDKIKEQKELNPGYQQKKDKARKLFEDIFSFSGNCNYLFSTFYPENINQLAPIAYNLLLRKGWFFSTSSFTQLKRKTCYMFGEGSVFKSTSKGKLVDVTPSEFSEHRVFRYGLPFTIPFNEV